MLLVSGALTALQTMSIVAAFPFMVLIIFMAVSLLKSLRNAQRQMELHKALLQERVQRMLQEHEARREAGRPADPSVPAGQPEQNTDPDSAAAEQ